MAAITSTVLGLGAGAISIAQANKQKNEARKALNSYERQELDNPMKDIPLSTVGSDLMREETGRTAATLTDSASRFGIRGMSVIPAIQANINSANQEGRSYLDQQDTRRQYAIAQGEQNVQNMQETREREDLAGIGQLMNVGNQNMQQGIGLGLNSLMMGTRAIGEKYPDLNFGSIFGDIGGIFKGRGSRTMAWDSASQSYQPQ